MTESHRFLGLAAAAQLAFLVLPEQRHMRYLMPVVPLFALAEAHWLAWALQWHRGLGAALVGLALATNVLQSPHWQVPLAAFFGELRHAYRGPMEGVVEHLRALARPSDVVKIPYDDRTLMFYTDVGIELPSRFLEATYPEWIVIRRDWIPGEFFSSAYFQTITASYERIALEAPDVLWQNREDPGAHHFRTVTEAPPVVIYRRREVPAAAARGPA